MFARFLTSRAPDGLLLTATLGIATAWAMRVPTDGRDLYLPGMRRGSGIRDRRRRWYCWRLYVRPPCDARPSDTSTVCCRTIEAK